MIVAHHFCKLTSPIIVRLSYRSLSLNVERLEHRSIIKLRGNDLFGFLQGLITNDIHLLTNQQNSLYTFLLNSKGRILFDALIYKISNVELLLECDSLVKDDLVNHLKAYCVRKKIQIEPEDRGIWVIFPNNFTPDFSKLPDKKANSPSFSLENEIHLKKVFETNTLLFRDPRLSALGFRTISATSVNIANHLTCSGVNVSSSEEFASYRFKCGIAEGLHELLVGNSFPHEANGDYLNGISFNKGCYIGQELTARVQHTGVVRKRLMPLILSSIPTSKIENDSVVASEADKNIGKLRFLRGQCGIALLRVAEALESRSNLRIAGITACTYRPFWWPQQM